MSDGRFQFSLGIAIIVMLAAAGMLYVNMLGSLRMKVLLDGIVALCAITSLGFWAEKKGHRDAAQGLLEFALYTGGFWVLALALSWKS